MTWIAVSDDVHNKQLLTLVEELECTDTSLFHEFLGFAVHIYALIAGNSKGKTPEYQIPVSSVLRMGDKKRMNTLIEYGKKTGLFKKRTVKVDGFENLSVLADDKWIHIFDPKDNRSRNDNRDKALLGPVLLRDGSNCRWCGMFVFKRSGGGKTAKDTRQIDHLRDDYENDEETCASEVVVACKNCNQAKNKPSRSSSKYNINKLLPEPKRGDKLFHAEVVEFLTNECGYNFLKFEKTDIEDRYKLSLVQSKAEREVLVEACVSLQNPDDKT
ncbi:MAG: hypothetical protein LBI63_00045, partial [Candidatus Ancillula sp.]|nr:hypothetical protein [Candidatus Ancillula sp.]